MRALLHESPLEQYEMLRVGQKIIEVSGEMVVPDKMPDIGLLGNTNAYVLLRSKRVEAGCGFMDGDLALSVCFVPDGSAGFRVLNMQLPWSVEIGGDVITDDAVAVGEVLILNLETRMLNPRKILVKAKLEAEMRFFAGRKISVCDGVVGDETVQVCKEHMDCCVVSTVCEKTFAATDEYPLPPEITGGEVLSKSVQFRVEDLKNLSNKLIVKGSVLTDAVVAAESGEAVRISFTTAFSFIAETDCEQLTDDVCINILPTAMYYEPSSNGKVLSMEVHGVCQMTVYRKKEIVYLSDAYSNFYPCECCFEPSSIYREVKLGSHRENISGNIVCRSQMTCVRFLTSSYTVNGDGENAQLSVLVEACVQCENGMIDWVRNQVTVPTKLKPGERLTCVRMGELYGSCNGTELQYRMTIELETEEVHAVTLNLLSSAVCDEECPIESMGASIAVVRKGGRLWDLARSYGSTVGLIRTYNEIEEDEVPFGELLLIPRQRK